MRLLLALPFASLVVASADENRFAALPIAPNDITPRYFLDKSHPLARRDGSCGSGNHDCLDVNHPERCCPNDTYCYVDNTFNPRCCPIGSPCTSDSPCASTAFFCTISRTVPVTSGTHTTASVTRETGCCNRACPQTSQYLCPSNLGGNCCPYGSNCQQGGLCTAIQTASPPPPGLTPAADQCTTSQYRCPGGTSCCNNTQVCTQFDGSQYCAATASPTSTSTVAPDSSGSGGGGLSVGAKVGIALGAVVGAFLIIGAIVYLFITKRRGRSTGSGDGSRIDGGGDGVSTSAYRESNHPDGDNDAALPGEGGMTSVTRSSPAWPHTRQWSNGVSSPDPELDREHIMPESPPVEIGSVERAEAPVHEAWSPKSGVTSTFADFERRETIDGRFELDNGSALLSPNSLFSPQPPYLDETLRESPEESREASHEESHEVRPDESHDDRADAKH